MVQNQYKLISRFLDLLVIKKDTKGIIPIETIVASNKSKTTFFVVDANPSYHALLGRDWIHTNKCIPSSIHQKLLLVKEDKEVEIVDADNQPFYTSLNYVEAHLYQDNVGPIDVKEPLKDLSANDWDDISFGLFGLAGDENMDQ